jgi:hypothetical protein
VIVTTLGIVSVTADRVLFFLVLGFALLWRVREEQAPAH